eukprot:6059063-Pleurochrysis_carterae.AAC.1
MASSSSHPASNDSASFSTIPAAAGSSRAAVGNTPVKVPTLQKGTRLAAADGDDVVDDDDDDDDDPYASATTTSAPFPAGRHAATYEL